MASPSLNSQPIEGRIEFVDDSNSADIQFLTKSPSSGGALTTRMQLGYGGTLGLFFQHPGQPPLKLSPWVRQEEQVITLILQVAMVMP